MVENSDPRGVCFDCAWDCLPLLGYVMRCPWHRAREPGAARQERPHATRPPAVPIPEPAGPRQRRERHANTNTA